MRAPAIVLVPLLGFACTPRGAGPASEQPTEQATEQATEQRGATVEDPGSTPRGPIELHPIALREGSMIFAEPGEHPYLLIDGEPIPLQPGVAPTRVPELGLGLAPIEAMFGSMFTVVDLEGPLDDRRGFLVLREDFERAGSSHHVYELGDGGWRARALERRGSVTEYYSALVTTADGALLGLRGFELSAGGEYMEVESPEFWAKVDAERASAPAGFALLAGATARMPSLPKGWMVQDAMSTSTGHIVALAYQSLPEFNWGPLRLLEWAPGQVTPTISSLPGVADERIETYTAELWPAGERVIITSFENALGDEPSRGYLALGGTEGWARVAVDLPSGEGPSPNVSSAAMTDDGELWITIDDYNAAHLPSTLWHQAGGEWRPVELPGVDSLTEGVDASERWAYDRLQQEWVSVPAGDPGPAAPAAKYVMWSGGELWVIAEIGRAYPNSQDLYADDSRTVVYASRPVDEPVWLPSFDQLQLERVDRAVLSSPKQPGGLDCYDFTIVVHDQPGEFDAIAAKLGSGEDVSSRGAMLGGLFVGAPLDDPARAQLVYSARANSVKEAKALIEFVGKRAGTRVEGDCRPRTMVRLISGA